MSSDETEKIKNFWQSRALNRELEGAGVTHNDSYQRALEIDILLQYLPSGQRILDVGCGNGYSTSVYAKYASEVVGIDYSPAMIDRAKEEYGHLENVRFEVQDILNVDLLPASFDVAITQRCLINLASWEDQRKGIGNIARLIRPGGYFIFQEGTQQGREKLNQTRELLGLSRMPDVAYNLDFDETLLWPYIRQYFAIVDIRYFGLYDLISRIIHPLLVSPEEPRYDAKINHIAYLIAAKMRGVDEIGREFSALLRRLDQ